MLPGGSYCGAILGYLMDSFYQCPLLARVSKLKVDMSVFFLGDASLSCLLLIVGSSSFVLWFFGFKYHLTVVCLFPFSSALQTINS